MKSNFKNEIKRKFILDNKIELSYEYILLEHIELFLAFLKDKNNKRYLLFQERYNPTILLIEININDILLYILGHINFKVLVFDHNYSMYYVELIEKENIYLCSKISALVDFNEQLSRKKLKEFYQFEDYFIEYNIPYINYLLKQILINNF